MQEGSEMTTGSGFGTSASVSALVAGRPSDRDAVSAPRLAALTGADAILNKKQVAAMIGVSISTLDRLVALGAFHQPIQLSPRRVGWPLSTVQAWTASRPQREA
jgi:predicted DNA-binding transcriptional regulator AlpA